MRVQGNFLRLIVLCIMIFLIVGCNSQTSIQDDNGSPSEPTDHTELSEWEQLVEAANKEGRLILMGQADNTLRDAIIRGFNEQYPDIRIEYRAGSQGGEVITRLTSERDAGVYETDLLLWGATTTYNDLIPAGIVEPIDELLILEDFNDPNLWVGGRLDYADTEGRYILSFTQALGNMLLVNTDMINISELNSYEDLLKPEFEGKLLIADPRHVGQSRYAFGFFLDYFGEEYIEALAATNPAINADVHQLIDWVAQGRYAMGISPGNDNAFQEYIEAGVPVQGIYLKEGGYYSPGYNNVSLIANAPNPNAAKLFTNWIFTPEGQQVITNANLASSVRTDQDNQLQADPDKHWFLPASQFNEEIVSEVRGVFAKYFD